MILEESFGEKQGDKFAELVHTSHFLQLTHNPLPMIIWQKYQQFVSNHFPFTDATS